jgi:hypothetical protein
MADPPLAARAPGAQAQLVLAAVLYLVLRLISCWRLPLVRVAQGGVSFGQLPGTGVPKSPFR